jgi:hypothetical protein
MSKEIESVAAALFDKIRSRFSPVTLGDEKAKATEKPENARFFNFTYADSNGDQFGKITMSLIDEESLKIYFGQNIIDHMDETQRKDWYHFLRNLRLFAKRNLLSFDTRDITKSNLNTRDVKQQSKNDDVYQSEEVPVTESRLYGTPGRPYNSMADKGSTKILVRHSAKPNDEVRGSRTRKIEEIFLETERGERFLLGHKNLNAAYAMAEHLNQGGTVYDEIAECIDGMVNEMNAMKHFVRSTKLREFEDQETSDMTQAAVHHYEKLKNTLRSLRNERQYNEFVSNYSPATPIADDIDVDNLRERFVKKVYDDRFTDALPYVYRAYQQQKNEAAGQFGSELDEWAESITEDALGDVDIKGLAELVKTSLPGGINGIDAISALEQVLPNRDDLTGQIARFSSGAGQGSDADTRPLIKAWLRDNMPEVLDQLQFGQRNQDDAQTNFVGQVSPEQAHPKDEYGASSLDEPVVNESDDMEFLRRLAGLTR